ncbi:MAG: cytochrome C [Gammaproteobacteria bacterium]|nr:cytochrome C [Gammaproteobacteria bacterium]
MDYLRKIISTLVISTSIAACVGGDDDDDHEGSTLNVIDADKTHQVLAFNDQGMHCADSDYSVFTILPPFNTVRAQVIEKAAAPRILDEGVATVSYMGVADAAGSINTTSQNQPGGIWKSNFWDTNPDTGNSYAFDLFGIDLQPDEGLLGQQMPGILNPYVANDPQPFGSYAATQAWFTADGVPIMPIDDFGQVNPYPLMRISAADSSSGDSLATLDVVLPVASEAGCQNCHATDQDYIDYPEPIDLLNAAKRNILMLHDTQHGTALASNTPVLCADCHYSEALAFTWNGGSNKTLSNVMHEHHGTVASFPSDSMEDTCYQCHPGERTDCLRGAMGSAGMECQDCHGGMLAVGSDSREPWLDEPRCESCHTGDAVDNLTADADTVVNTLDTDGNTDNIRLRQAWRVGDPSATPIIAVNARFAEQDNKLYKDSLGHGGVACEGCHGSTHAIWPSSIANDNQAAIDLQGYSGTIIECGVCHTSLPLTLGGPHGMHNVNSSAWTMEHEGFYERNPSACRACHGVNLEGTILSRTAADRNFLRDDDGDSTIHLPQGTPVGCGHCHSKP